MNIQISNTNGVKNKKKKAKALDNGIDILDGVKSPIRKKNGKENRFQKISAKWISF